MNLWRNCCRLQSSSGRNRNSASHTFSLLVFPQVIKLESARYCSHSPTLRYNWRRRRTFFWFDQDPGIWSLLLPSSHTELLLKKEKNLLLVPPGTWNLEGEEEEMTVYSSGLLTVSRSEMWTEDRKVLKTVWTSELLMMSYRGHLEDRRTALSTIQTEGHLKDRKTPSPLPSNSFSCKVTN